MTQNDAAIPAAVVALIEEIRALPYGRPSGRDVATMLAERRGTCSTKHRYLFERIAQEFPALRPQLVHRVYTVDAGAAARRFGPRAARAVPDGGLVDVHRYLTLETAAGTVVIDATFPGPRWDGRGSMPLACGPGTDHPAAGDPDAHKRELERRHCDPRVREPFIAALAGQPARDAG